MNIPISLQSYIEFIKTIKSDWIDNHNHVAKTTKRKEKNNNKAIHIKITIFLPSYVCIQKFYAFYKYKWNIYILKFTFYAEESENKQNSEIHKPLVSCFDGYS